MSISAVKHVGERAAPQRPTPRLPKEVSPRDFFEHDFLERFFEFPIPQRGHDQRGLESGVVVRVDGYILTNEHLVGEADKVNVTLADKRQLPAKVIGTDTLTDLAALKIDATGLPAARLGDTIQLEVGDWVLAIGRPFGLEQTVTAGIISAKGRARVGITANEDFLLTDAAVNPGNRGGPLVNLKGEIIGINSAVAYRTGGYMGIGFANPSDQAHSVMQSILKDGCMTRGWLGAVIQDLTSEKAASFDFHSTAGVLNGDVVSGSSADRAGLRPGDIVVQFNRLPATDADQLRNAVVATSPGSKTAIEIVREGNEGRPQSVTVTIGLLEDEFRTTSAAAEPADEHGLTVQPLTRDIARQLGITFERSIVIAGVRSGSSAEHSGFRAGDLLIAIGNRQVETVKDFGAAMRDQDLARGVRLHIKSDGV